MKKRYQNIIKHYESCLAKHGDSHLGVDWPNENDALLRYQVMLEVVRCANRDAKPYTLLDFGCGTSGLLDYMITLGLQDYSYSGLDVSEAFVSVSQKKYPDYSYYNIDILEEPESLPNHDFIICNGVLTEKQDLSFEAMWQYSQELIEAVFNKASVGIAFNVMSKAVDWERDDLFHLSTDLLIDFLTQNLSRHFVIRNDYGLYEYTVYVYK